MYSGTVCSQRTLGNTPTTSPQRTSSAQMPAHRLSRPRPRDPDESPTRRIAFVSLPPAPDNRAEYERTDVATPPYSDNVDVSRAQRHNPPAAKAVAKRKTRTRSGRVKKRAKNGTFTPTTSIATTTTAAAAATTTPVPSWKQTLACFVLGIAVSTVVDGATFLLSKRLYCMTTYARWSFQSYVYDSCILCP